MEVKKYVAKVQMNHNSNNNNNNSNSNMIPVYPSPPEPIFQTSSTWLTSDIDFQGVLYFDTFERCKSFSTELATDKVHSIAVFMSQNLILKTLESENNIGTNSTLMIFCSLETWGVDSWW